MNTDPALAFDREPQPGESVRRYDAFGRLHISSARLTAAVVSPYIGHEIPGWQGLGLERDRVYKLFRDSEEIAKAASTANNIQLLSRHVGVTAKDHKPDIVIGSTGTDAVFKFPWLENSLVVWAEADIGKIDEGLKRSLSMSYSYQPDMTPGSFEGEAFDGSMRSLHFNHCAVVIDPRVPGALIGDSNHPPQNFKEIFAMATQLLSRKAVLVQGAVLGHLADKLAVDAKPIDLTTLLSGVTAENFKISKAAILAGLGELTKGKLAADAKLDGLPKVLGAFDEVDPKEEEKKANDEEETEAEKEAREKKEREAKDKKAKDRAAKDRAVKDAENLFVKEDETEAEKEARLARAKDKAAKDEEAKEAESKERKEAMDEAIATASKTTRDLIMTQMRAARDAEAFVFPYVGKLAIAYDSAEEIERAAALVLKIPNAAKLHASALRTVIGMMPKAGERHSPRLAADARPADDGGFATRFPNAMKIKVLG